MNQAAPRRSYRYRVPADHPAGLLLYLVLFACVIAMLVVGIESIGKGAVSGDHLAVVGIAGAVGLLILGIL